MSQLENTIIVASTRRLKPNPLQMEINKAPSRLAPLLQLWQLVGTETWSSNTTVTLFMMLGWTKGLAFLWVFKD